MHVASRGWVPAAKGCHVEGHDGVTHMVCDKCAKSIMQTSSVQKRWLEFLEKEDAEWREPLT
eukprot:gene2538-12235_t